MLCGLETFFLESSLPDYAAELIRHLQRYPKDVSAVISRAEIARIREDDTELEAALAALDLLLPGRTVRRLDWDRRVALATVLAQSGRVELARDQATRCYVEADESRIRALSPKSLFRFLALGRLFQLEPGDPTLMQLARKLLPPNARIQLQ
jgi:hypothetical protein